MHCIRRRALSSGPKHVQSLWKAKAIYITENGCAAPDELAEDGNVHDIECVMYLFGVVYVDFETQKRTPTMSARFLQEVSARNAVA